MAVAKIRGALNKVAACLCLCIDYFRVRTSGSTDKHTKKGQQTMKKTTLSNQERGKGKGDEIAEEGKKRQMMSFLCESKSR